MLLYFSIIFTLYYLFVLLMIIGWERIQAPQTQQQSIESDHFVSIVVAVRNEAKNIRKLLASLELQDYPVELFEVVIVDDQSEDNTAEIIEEFRSGSKLDIKLKHRPADNGADHSPKKYALAYGIQESKGDIIITTDGDCWMQSSWLQNMIRPFTEQSVHFVSGPVVIQPNESFFSKIQALEFSSLIGSGAALIGLNYPLMCNGANLAFRKDVYNEVGGYENINKTASGDDVFLMQKIFHRFGAGIIFNKSTDLIVYTNPKKSIKDLINQRRRWASKWNIYLLNLSWLLPVFLFVHYLSLFALLIVPLFKQSLFLPAFILIAIKVIIEYIFLKKIMDFCNLRLRFGVFIVSELIYPVYAIIVGIFVHFGKWRWKGRTHKR